MAKGNVKGPLGPIMLAILVGIALFMVLVVQSPELSEKFVRPEGFYDNMFEKVAAALGFAVVVSAIVAVARLLFRK